MFDVVRWSHCGKIPTVLHSNTEQIDRARLQAMMKSMDKPKFGVSIEFHNADEIYPIITKEAWINGTCIFGDITK